SRYVRPDEVPTDGRVRVIIGSYDGMTSPIEAPAGITYLLVSLKDGERWTYVPSRDHEVAWMAVADGTALVDVALPRGEMIVFDEGSTPIEIVARGSTRFVIGSAKKHRHDLVLGNYSVHTSEDALAQGEAEILRIGKRLRANGTLRR
ncbi:MAG: pirin family protein, partial [Polyangiaceae bacterium]